MSAHAPIKLAVFKKWRLYPVLSGAYHGGVLGTLNCIRGMTLAASSASG